jgi:hypothetical protein
MSNSALGLSSSVSYAGKYVQSVSVGNNGVVTATLRTISELGAAGVSGSNTVIYTPVSQGGGNLRWNVSASSVPQKYRPRT